MNADANLQVWLDLQSSIGKTTVIPYVRSIKDMQINYRLEVVQQSGGGRSSINQEGRVDAQAQTATSLARVVVGTQGTTDCKVELVLREGVTELGKYKFDCSR